MHVIVRPKFSFRMTQFQYYIENDDGDNISILSQQVVIVIHLLNISIITLV